MKGRCPKARREGRSLSRENLLWPVSIPGSGVEPLGETCLSVVEECPRRGVAAFRRNYA